MLIKNMAQFAKVYGGVQRSMEFESWEAFLNEAAEFHLEPPLGMEFLAFLAEKVDNSNADSLLINGTDNEKRLISLLQIAQSAYADFEGMMRQIISTGDNGKMINSPQNAQATSKWATVAAIKAALRRGDNALEKALAFLEEHIADFDEFKNSDRWTKRGKLIVSSAVKLTGWFPFCNYSRRMYVAMEPELERSQKLMASMVGKEFWTTVELNNKEITEGGNVGEEWITLIDKVGRVISLRAMVERVVFLNIDQDWHLWSETDGIDNKDVLKQDRRTEIKRDLEKELDDAKADLLGYLQVNSSAVLFGEFFNSDLYVGPEAKVVSKNIYENKPENRYVIM